MKSLRQLCAAFMLTLALTVSTFAGQMSTTVVDPPPPAPEATTQGSMSTTVAGQIETNIIATDPTTEVALNLLQSLLALF